MINKDIENITEEWEERTKLDSTVKVAITIETLIAVYFITEAIIHKEPIYIICTILYLALAMVMYRTSKIIKAQEVIIDMYQKLENKQNEIIIQQQQSLEERNNALN